VDAIGKINSRGFSEWMPNFQQTLSELDGLTIFNGYIPGLDLLENSEGFMREDFMEGDADNIREMLDLVFLKMNLEC